MSHAFTRSVAVCLLVTSLASASGGRLPQNQVRLESQKVFRSMAGWLLARNLAPIIVLISL